MTGCEALSPQVMSNRGCRWEQHGKLELSPATSRQRTAAQGSAFNRMLPSTSLYSILCARHFMRCVSLLNQGWWQQEKVSPEFPTGVWLTHRSNLSERLLRLLYN